MLRLQIVHLVRYMLACTSADSNLFWKMMNTRWHVFQHIHHYSVKVINSVLAYLNFSSQVIMPLEFSG